MARVKARKNTLRSSAAIKALAKRAAWRDRQKRKEEMATKAAEKAQETPKEEVMVQDTNKLINDPQAAWEAFKNHRLPGQEKEDARKLTERFKRNLIREAQERRASATHIIINGHGYSQRVPTMGFNTAMMEQLEAVQHEVTEEEAYRQWYENQQPEIMACTGNAVQSREEESLEEQVLALRSTLGDSFQTVVELSGLSANVPITDNVVNKLVQTACDLGEV